MSLEVIEEKKKRGKNYQSIKNWKILKRTKSGPGKKWMKEVTKSLVLEINNERGGKQYTLLWTHPQEKITMKQKFQANFPE